MPSSYRQNGFTLIELIMVIVITGILAGIVAIFIKTPVDQYLAIARRAAITDIADTAMRRMGRDIRTAVPNSVRLLETSTYLEFLPTGGDMVNGVLQGGGGRYRANATPAAFTVPRTDPCYQNELTGDSNSTNALSFSATDSCFEILGPPITFTTGDMIVVGSTQSDGNLPYQAPSSAGSIRRAYVGTIATTGTSIVVITPTVVVLPYSAMINPSYRFDIVPGSQQAVTYACENLGTDGKGNGLGTLTRYWAYGFYPAQPTPAAILASTTKSSAVLADKLSDCSFVYTGSDPRNALVAISLTITQGYESVSLYQEVHVNNLP
jgi:MSHA biogenesis protein MshO